jgi:hypothetical protein
MGFTTPAFIRKNTPELRKKLAVLGYKYDYRADFCHDIIYVDAERNEFFPTFSSNITDDEIAIDCGANEELFLSIASLRDDTDKYQWFTNGKGDWGMYRDGSDGNLPGMDFFGMPNDFDLSHYHKATVNELIEHFKI